MKGISKNTNPIICLGMPVYNGEDFLKQRLESIINQSYSNFILQSPTSPKFKSLNLSHSLTIICNEIFTILNEKKIKTINKDLKISTKSKVLSVVNHLVNLLEKKDFFTPIEKKQSMLMNINNLIYRLEPNDKELRILASIISSLYKNNTKP